MTKTCFSVLAILVLAACAGAEIKHTYPRDNIYGKPVTAKQAERAEKNSLSAALGFLDDSEDQNTKNSTGISVNRYLWNASLDTLSFLPLQSTDPFGGVIITDWGTTKGKPNERVKVTARIISPDLRASALTVNVHRQIKDETGNWETASISEETVRQLEDSILQRARQLRIASLE